MDLNQSYYPDIDLRTQQIYNDTIDEALKLPQFKDTKKIKVLDVGSGLGGYTFAMAPKVKKIVGIEPYKKAYNQAVKQNKFKNVEFHNCMIEDFKTNEKFDLIINLSSIEHMPDADKSFSQMFALLKKGGYMYITAPNKLWPLEGHYVLPFLSYLPLQLANMYLKITGKGKSYEDSSYAKTYWGMKKFLRQYPCIYRFVLPDVNASYLGCGVKSKSHTLAKGIGVRLISKFPFMWAISKGFIILCKKTEN